jgi:hypothetical protein
MAAGFSAGLRRNGGADTGLPAFAQMQMLSAFDPHHRS